jgi:hypothetical protein
MTTLEDPGLFAPPTRLRQPAFWMSLIALVFLIVGLCAIAIPDAMSGPVVWEMSADHGLRQADLIGALLLLVGSSLIWITSLVWQWRHTH